MENKLNNEQRTMRICDFVEVNYDKLFSLGENNRVKIKEESTGFFKHMLLTIFLDNTPLIAGDSKFTDIKKGRAYSLVERSSSNHPHWLVIKEIDSDREIELNFSDFINVFSQSPLPQT